MAPHATPGIAGEFSGPITSELHYTKQRRWYFFPLLIKSHSDAGVGHFQRCKHTASCFLGRPPDVEFDLNT